MTRASWRSRVGFIFAAAGSAVGLANVWRFPYIVGQYGGSAFVMIYLLCLFLIGFPVFVSEVLLGRKTQKNPKAAYQELGKTKLWSFLGGMSIFNGFIISSFYSVIAGWVLGYLVAALKGSLTQFTSTDQTVAYFHSLVSSPLWSLTFHLLFMLGSFALLLSGVRKGLETGSKVMMPILLIVLMYLAMKGLMMPEAYKGLSFYFKPNWSLITPTAIVVALGHSFFTLSLGQGTMITYGSYINKNENIPLSCLPIGLVDTGVALLAGVAIFPFVFSTGLEPASGPGLVFYVLPLVFSKLAGGLVLAVLFFLLLTLAAITSEISALEPLIAYLIDEKKFTRSKAVTLTCLGAFVLGIPAALSNMGAQVFTLFGTTFFDAVSFVILDLLVPISGFCTVLLVGWRWGIRPCLDSLNLGAETFFLQNPWARFYFMGTIRYTAPLLILVIILNLLGIF